MTRDKLSKIFCFYDDYLRDEIKCGISRCESGMTPDHWRWMCVEAVTVLIPGGKIEKAMRWLGFLQGVFCALEYFTLEELKHHSRPTEEGGL